MFLLIIHLFTYFIVDILSIDTYIHTHAHSDNYGQFSSQLNHPLHVWTVGGSRSTQRQAMQTQGEPDPGNKTKPPFALRQQC